MDNPTNIRIYGTVQDSIVDGPGLRFGVFTQGCSHACPGCHNPESHDPSGGTLTTVQDILAQIEKNPLVKGVTLSGGEPFEQADACAEIAEACKARGLNVWAYSGYLYEDLSRIAKTADAPQGSIAEEADPVETGIYETAHAKRGNVASLSPQGVKRMLACLDVLVDGPFVESLHSYDLKWRGSSNQRLVDVPASRKAGKVVKWEPYTFVPPKPASW